MSEHTHDDDRRTARETASAYAQDLAADLEHARDVIAERPLDPSPDALATLGQTIDLPAMVGDVLVIDYSISRGRPMHGALRSDDHVSLLTLRLPLEDLADCNGLEIPERCPECHHDRARYHTSTHHHIAGLVAVTCPVCDHEHDGDAWG